MLCRSLPRNADGADPFRPLRGRRLHQAERLGSAPFIMAAPISSYEGLGLVQGSGWLFQELDIYVGARDRLALIVRKSVAVGHRVSVRVDSGGSSTINKQRKQTKLPI